MWKWVHFGLETNRRYITVSLKIGAKLLLGYAVNLLRTIPGADVVNFIDVKNYGVARITTNTPVVFFISSFLNDFRQL